MNMLFVAVLSQATWAKAYGGGATFAEWVRCLIQTSDGGFIVGAGMNLTWTPQAAVIKLRSDGSVQWAKTSTEWVDPITSIIQTSDGGYAGTVSYDGSAFSNVFKLNSSGAGVWTRLYEWLSNIVLWDIVQTPDNGYAVLGWGWVDGAGYPLDPILLKLNSTGGFQWARTITISGTQYARSLIRTSDNGLAMGIECQETGSLLLVKLNSNYALQWAKRIDRSGTPERLLSANSLIQTQDDGYAITGSSGYDLFVVKLNSSGDLVWARTVDAGGAWGEIGFSIVQTTDGGYAIGGDIDGAYDDFPIMLRLDASGNLLWAREYSFALGAAWAMIQTTDGGYAATACYDGSGSGQPFILLKMDSEGYIQNSSCIYEITPTVTDVTSSVSVTGFTPSLTTPSGLLYSNWDLPVDFNPNVSSICEPLYEGMDESGSYVGLTCSPVPGGLIFKTQSEVPVRIYFPDGRLAYSDKLQKGENRITLGTGVYIWRAGPYKGKAIVK